MPRADPSWVEQIPLQVVPRDLTTEIADLAFAGRYIPAGPGPDPIAGDFFDLLALEPDLIALVVGDVAGHGVGAVARMHQLQAATRAYAVIEHGPASVISRLDILCARLDPESIATLWYGEYQPSTGTLTYASAGHPPPVLIWHNDPTRLLHGADAPPLGVGVAGELVVEYHDLRGARASGRGRTSSTPTSGGDRRRPPPRNHARRGGLDLAGSAHTPCSARMARVSWPSPRARAALNASGSSLGRTSWSRTSTRWM
jgi:hypothetical protein